MFAQVCSWFQEYPVLYYYAWFVVGFAAGMFQEVCVEEIKRRDNAIDREAHCVYRFLGFPNYNFRGGDAADLSERTLLWGQHQWWKHLLAWVSAIGLAPLYLA